MLSAYNISIHFGNERILDQFSCHIERGAFVCITGISGCGKTSLLKSFLGLTPLASGSIKVNKVILSEATCGMIRKNISYLPQDLALPYDTVDEAVRQIIRIGGLNLHSCKISLHTNMEKLGLDKELLDKRLAEISGGQRQRLMLATLSLLDREVWLLDEPTAALDKISRNYVIDFLIEQQHRGQTIVAVSHDTFFSAQCSTIIPLR